MTAHFTSFTQTTFVKSVAKSVAEMNQPHIGLWFYATITTIE
jgi:hypothetical protein